MNAVTVSLKFIPTIALLNRLCVLTSPKYIICIIKYLWVLFLTMMGKISVFICKEWQQRVWVTYFVFVVLWRDFEFFFDFFQQGLRWWAELLNVCSLISVIGYFYQE